MIPYDDWKKVKILQFDSKIVHKILYCELYNAHINQKDSQLIVRSRDFMERFLEQPQSKNDKEEIHGHNLHGESFNPEGWDM